MDNQIPKKVLTGIVAERVQELVGGICKEGEVEILKGLVSKAHVHLLISLAPHLAISKLVPSLKGKSCYKSLSKVFLRPAPVGAGSTW